MYTMKFARLPTGKVQIKEKEPILVFFLFSKLSFKPGEGEGSADHAQRDVRALDVTVPGIIFGMPQAHIKTP